MNRQEYIKAKAACFRYELEQVLRLNDCELSEWAAVLDDEESDWAQHTEKETAQHGIDDLFYECAADTITEYTDEELKDWSEL